MNYNFQNNNSKKKEAGEKNIHCKLNCIFNKNLQDTFKSKKIKDGGFVAWPQNKLSSTQQRHNIKISQGHLKDGGYVAYPQND